LYIIEDDPDVAWVGENLLTKDSARELLPDLDLRLRRLTTISQLVD